MLTDRPASQPTDRSNKQHANSDEICVCGFWSFFFVQFSVMLLCWVEQTHTHVELCANVVGLLLFQRRFKFTQMHAHTHTQRLMPLPYGSGAASMCSLSSDTRIYLYFFFFFSFLFNVRLPRSYVYCVCVCMWMSFSRSRWLSSVFVVIISSCVLCVYATSSVCKL